MSEDNEQPDLSDSRAVERIMETARNEGKMELAVGEDGKLRGRLTPEGQAEARRLWRGILEVGPEVSDEELEALIEEAGDEWFGKRPDAD